MAAAILRRAIIVPILCWALLAATGEAAARIAILVPGTYHRGEVRRADAGRWWALCRGPSELVYRRVKVSIRVVRDVVSEDPRGGRKVSVRGCDEPIVLLRGLEPPGRPPAAAEVRSPRRCHFIQRGVTQGACSVQLRFREGSAVLRNDSHAGTSTVTLMAAGRERTLFSAEKKRIDDGSWDVVWAGDLDGDGELDLLLRADRHYNVRTLRLFLSSHGLRQVATFRSVGC